MFKVEIIAIGETSVISRVNLKRELMVRNITISEKNRTIVFRVYKIWINEAEILVYFHIGQIVGYSISWCNSVIFRQNVKIRWEVQHLKVREITLQEQIINVLLMDVRLIFLHRETLINQDFLGNGVGTVWLIEGRTVVKMRVAIYVL